MNEPTMETLTRRLDRVELENRRLKRARVAILAVIASVALMGQVIPKSRTIEAERFLVRDANGTQRGGLGVWGNGSAALLIFEREGKTISAALAEGPDDSARLELRSGGLILNDRNSERRAVFGMLPEGLANLVLMDNEGNSRAYFGVTEDGAQLAFFDKAKRAIWRAP